MAFKQALNTSVTTTANGALAFDGTGSSLVDHFSTVTARTHKECDSSAMSDDTIRELTAKAHAEDPALCARLIAHLRDCRGGKGERHAAKVAWTWWLDNFPLQAVSKLEHLPFYGSLRDLTNWFSGTKWQFAALSILFKQLNQDWERVEECAVLSSVILGEKAPDILNTKLEDLSEFIKRGHAVTQPEFDFSEEQKQLGKLLSLISLAGKWAPRENAADDKKAKLAKMSPPSFTLASTWEVDRRVYRRRIAVLTALCNVVEVSLCAQKYDKIDLSKVPSRALHLYGKKCFPKHLGEKYSTWLNRAKTGEVKVNTSQVDPYEVVSPYVDNYGYGGSGEPISPEHNQLAELFFRTHVSELKQKFGEETMDGSVVVLDTSGSMYGPPMKAGLGLALWLSACASDAWRNMFISFSSRPEVVNFTDESTLEERINLAMKSAWEMNTDLQATARLMVERAKMCGVGAESMPKRVIIVSDMQFDHCGNSQTNYDAYCKVFSDAGYNVPTIVFWNVSGKFDGKAAPARAHDEGVIMLSGFSKELMSILINQGPVPTPYDIMLKTLSNERYDCMTE